ncbi:MAG: CHAT domain-containing tetratricopeptide repeat protein [Cyanobacteria bacterium J06639_18]
MRYYKFGKSVFVSLLVVLSASFVPRLPMVVMTSGVLAQSKVEREAEADSLFQQGIEQFQTSQFEAAIQSWQQALIIYREIKDRKSEGNVLSNIGAVYGAMGDYPKLIKYQKQSLVIARELQDRLGEGYSLGNLGIAYYFLGDHKKAIEYFQQTLAIARKLKDRKGEGNSLNNLGNAYGALGDYPKTIEYNQKSLAIKKEIKDRLGEANSLGNLGNAYGALGDYSKAIEYQQQRLAISREIKDRLGERKALVNLGNVYNVLGDYPKAIEYHQQNLAIAREIKDRSGEGNTLGELGIAHYAMGNYKKAIEYHSSSLAIAREIQSRDSEAAALGNLGNVYDALENYPKAIEYHSSSLAIARELKDGNSESRSLGNLGNVYDALGDYKKAIEYHSSSLAIAREMKYRLGERKSLVNLGNSFYKYGDILAAERSIYKGIKVFESLRDKKLDDTNKISLFDARNTMYRDLQQVLVAQNKTDAALEISERGRGRAFVELLASRLSRNPKEQFPNPPNITEIKQIAKQQNSTLVQYSIIYDDFKVAGKQQYKQSELYIWVIKLTGEVTFRKADLKHLWKEKNTTLGKLVSTTRKSLGVGDNERSIFDVKVKNAVNEKIQRESLQKLHQLLVKPIADLLPTDPNQRVTFVPQDDLFLVPFPALMDSKGKYLIEKHTILTAPAIQVLELTREQQKRIKTLPKSSRKNALIVGNPTMPSFNTKYGEPGQKLSSLPGAKREAEAIAPLFNTTALTGDKATETAIKAKLPQAGLIHLATHGLFDGFQGLQSSIALAPSSQDNGLLTASEILDIKLNADLVVLSACNTGRGRITGDGVIGLSRSLISSGVPSVLVSLWSVPDSPTASLMTDFYQNLNKNPDKATALREAMLTRMKQHPNPRDWAAFTLIGEGS